VFPKKKKKKKNEKKKKKRKEKSPTRASGDNSHFLEHLQDFSW